MTRAGQEQTRAARRRALHRAARRRRAKRAGTAAAAALAACGFMLPIAAPAQAAIVGTGADASVLNATTTPAAAAPAAQTVDVHAQGDADLSRAVYSVAPRTIAQDAAALASAPQNAASQTTVDVSPGTAQQIGEQLAAARGWSGMQFTCLVQLWTKESSWRVTAYNPSGAYGIPQALPASKMASAGPDWRTDAATQIRWGLGYIAASYGTPCGAWAHETAHNWY